MPEARRQRRVSFRTSVRLRAPGRDHSVVARVQNLSRSGIFVTAPEMPAAGTEILCRMLVAGERCTLKGHVAWVQPPSPVHAADGASGAGIRFVGLTEREADLLAKLVAEPEDDRQPVDVWLEGQRAPIRSHAEVTDEALRLSTRLPFLRLGSPVKVTFVRRGVEEVREGALQEITLNSTAEDGIPRLRLLVSTPPQEAASGTIEAAAAGASSTPVVEALGPTTVVEPAVVEPALVEPPAVAPTREQDRTQKTQSPQPNPERHAPWSAPSWSRARPWVAAAMVAAAAALLAVRPWRSPPEPPAPAPRAPETRPFQVQIEPLPQPRAPEANVAPPSALPAPATTAISAPGLKLADVENDGAALFISLSGSVAGLKRYPLANPPGLAINLPRARALAPAGVHSLAGAWKRIVVQRRGWGTHLRLFFEPGHIADVQAAPSGLRVVLRAK